MAEHATNQKLSSEQLQRMELNKKKAKEKLTATSKKQKQLSGDRARAIQGPGTPVRVGCPAACTETVTEEQVTVVSRSQSVATACQVIAGRTYIGVK